MRCTFSTSEYACYSFSVWNCSCLQMTLLIRLKLAFHTCSMSSPRSLHSRLTCLMISFMPAPYKACIVPKASCKVRLLFSWICFIFTSSHFARSVTSLRFGDTNCWCYMLFSSFLILSLFYNYRVYTPSLFYILLWLLIAINWSRSHFYDSFY